MLKLNQNHHRTAYKSCKIVRAIRACDGFRLRVRQWKFAYLSDFVNVNGIARTDISIWFLLKNLLIICDTFDEQLFNASWE